MYVNYLFLVGDGSAQGDQVPAYWMWRGVPPGHLRSLPREKQVFTNIGLFMCVFAELNNKKIYVLYLSHREIIYIEARVEPKE